MFHRLLHPLFLLSGILQPFSLQKLRHTDIQRQRQRFQQGHIRISCAPLPAADRLVRYLEHSSQILLTPSLGLSALRDKRSHLTIS